MSETSSPKRPRVDYDDNKDDPFEKYKNRDQEDSVSFSKSKRKRDDVPVDEDEGKEEDPKSKSVNIETARREHTLVMRLTNKEQELQECMNQISEMKQSQTQNTAQLRSMLLDPAINLVFQRMAKEMDEHKEKLKQKQNELSAWKFTPDSQTGMRLMARVRMLLQENGELGKMISSGRTARLEGEISLQKALITEMKTNQKELDEFVGELEEDVEGMQGMIFMLQQQLKEAREQIARLQQENEQLRTLRMPPDPEPGGDSSNNVYGSNSSTPLNNPPPDTDADPNSSSNSYGPDSTAQKRTEFPRGGGAATDASVSSKKRSPVKTGPVGTSSSVTSTSVRRGGASSTSSSRDVPSAADSYEDEMNGGFLVFKATADSNMLTLEEEAPSSGDTEGFKDHGGGSSNVSQTGGDHVKSDMIRTTEIKTEIIENSGHNNCDVDSTQNGSNTSYSPGSSSSTGKLTSENPSSFSENHSVQQQTSGNSIKSLSKSNGSNASLTDHRSSEALVNDRTSGGSLAGNNGVDERTSPRLGRDGVSDRTASEDGERGKSASEIQTKLDSPSKQPLVNGSVNVPDQTV